MKQFQSMRSGKSRSCVFRRVAMGLCLAAVAGCGGAMQDEPSPPDARRTNEAGSVPRAMAFWDRFDRDTLTDFQEKGQRPDRLWLNEWGSPLASDEDRRLWHATLEAALPEALARAEQKTPFPPMPTVPLTPSAKGPPVATVERVSENPVGWYDRDVRFENVLLRGPIRNDADHGALLVVTSPAGKVYPASAQGDRLVFSTYRDAARDLKNNLADGRDVRATIDCKIVKDRRVILTGMKTFPKAVIYRVELYRD